MADALWRLKIQKFSSVTRKRAGLLKLWDALRQQSSSEFQGQIFPRWEKKLQEEGSQGLELKSGRPKR